jgi:hypothetical protein
MLELLEENKHVTVISKICTDITYSGYGHNEEVTPDDRLSLGIKKKYR